MGYANVWALHVCAKTSIQRPSVLFILVSLSHSHSHSLFRVRFIFSSLFWPLSVLSPFAYSWMHDTRRKIRLDTFRMRTMCIAYVCACFLFSFGVFFSGSVFSHFLFIKLSLTHLTCACKHIFNEYKASALIFYLSALCSPILFPNSIFSLHY